MPRWPSGAYFTASTAARASSAVLTWGTCTPQAPRSRNGAMISGLLPTGRTIGAMPASSAAVMQASAVSTVIEPCSLSSRIQSKPRCPSISTTGGEGKVHMTPKAAWPAYSRCLSVFSRMAGSIRRERASGAALAVRERDDLGRQRAAVVFQRHEQIGLERDEEVSGALLGGHSAREHAERVHRERQRIALVAAERQERAASRC